MLSRHINAKLDIDRWWITGLLIIAFYTFLTILFIPQVYFYNTRSSQPLPWWFVIARLAIGSYGWAMLTPLIFWFGRHFPIERQYILRRLLLHFCLSVSFAAVQTVIYHYGLILVQGGGSLRVLANPGYFLNFVTNGIIFYSAILGVHQANQYQRKYHDREFRLQQAQLQVLKMQLNPHFLFNALNAISELVYENQEKADRTINQLSDLLRISLESGSAQEVALKQELEFLEKYLEIQKTLMEERLNVNVDIDPDALDACVPNMILQPLVENCIRHGIAPRAEGGRIDIVAQREDGMLHVRVIDNGRGLPLESEEELSRNGGIGLANTQARLNHLYGSGYRFELRTAPGKGLVVSMKIPFRKAFPEP
jgi:two-component system, LytTR family, sensor kinase